MASVITFFVGYTQTTSVKAEVRSLTQSVADCPPATPNSPDQGSMSALTCCQQLMQSQDRAHRRWTLTDFKELTCSPAFEQPSVVELSDQKRMLTVWVEQIR